MKNRIVGIATLLVAAFASGCSHDAGGASHPIVINDEASGVVVQGHGEVQAEPDVAIVTLGVQIEAATVIQARELAAQAASNLIAALEKDGVAREDIQTTGLSIQPRYEYPPHAEPIQTGYGVSNTVTVKIRRIDAAGRLIDAAVSAGGDATRLHGIHFEIDDPTKVRAAARDRAVREARAKAEQLASLSGVDLGEVVFLEEVAFRAPIVPMAMSKMMESDASTPIAPGQTTVSVDVRVRWSIDG